MRSRPLTSVIITNYNYARFLPAAIDSALQQRYPDVEVIVVDDGSTDHSAEIIRSYGNEITPVFKQNEGQGDAINRGFSRSRGDIIIFLDADDMLLPHTVGRVVEVFQANEDVVKVMYRLEVIDASGRATGELKPHAHLPLRSGDLRLHVLTFPFDMTWTATSGNAFSATILRQLLPIPEKEFPILADFYLSHIVPLFGPITFLEEVGAYYRIHDTNNHSQTAPEVNLCYLRQHLFYAQKTCLYIKQVADRLGLEERPEKVSDLYSVSILSKRLTSLKLDAQGHPVNEDTAWKLFLAGVSASRRRFDVSWPMKVLYIVWFAMMFLAPKSVAHRLATVFSLPERRRPINRLLGTFHRLREA